MLVLWGGKRYGRMRRFPHDLRGRVEDYEANTFMQRSTVRSTTSSRVERCSICPVVETRCQCLGAVQERFLNNSVRSTINTKCVKAHVKLDPRMGGGPPRHHSVSEFGDARSFSGSNLQNFYASQRHQPSRGANEAEQVMQAKRRMAAQRERELRNYHQEQQYNRSRPPSSV
jgi:hypothetical protein